MNVDLKGFAVEKKSRSMSSHQLEQSLSADLSTATPHVGTVMSVHFSGHTGVIRGGAEEVPSMKSLAASKEPVGGAREPGGGAKEPMGGARESVGGAREPVGVTIFTLLEGGPVMSCFGELPWHP